MRKRRDWYLLAVLLFLLCSVGTTEAAVWERSAQNRTEQVQNRTEQAQSRTEQMQRQTEQAQGLHAHAETGIETILVQDELLDGFDLSSLEKFLQESGTEETMGMGFRELLHLLMEGDAAGLVRTFFDTVKRQLFQEITAGSRCMGQVLVLGLLGAVFANYSSIFSGSQIAETGFYVTYLLVITFLASSFLTGIAVAGELLERLLEFMRALVPTFFLAVSFAGGSITSAAGCSVMLFSMNLTQWLFLQMFLPLIRIHMLLVLAGHLVKEDLFSRATELLEQGIRWGLKTMTGLILGFHMLQGMVVPYADAIKNTPLRRFISVIPGVGQGAAAASQMVMGAGVLIKNSIGAGAVIILFVLSLVPLLKLVVLCLLYQGSAAVLQPVCDKRLVSCISAVGTGTRLLLSLSSSALLLFVLSLAIVCMGSNTMYFSG